MPLYIAPLYGLDNPGGPQWVVPHLSGVEVDQLYQAIVTFVGVDPRPTSLLKRVVIGSGFIVGAVESESIVVLSAAHIFSWWTDQVCPPRSHALIGLVGDKEDFEKRLRQVISEKQIFALVSTKSGLGGSILPLIGFSFNPNPRDGDIAVIQVAMPDGRTSDDFCGLPIDVDPVAKDEILLMAGISGGTIPAPAEGDVVSGGMFEQQLSVRAGRIGELVKKPDGHGGPMYRVNIPSLPGMSGGPLIRPRLANFLDDSTYALAAVGVVSSKRIEVPFLLDHCAEGETWAAPTLVAYPRRIGSKTGMETVGEAIKDGKVASIGRNAKRMTWSRNAAGEVDFALAGGGD